MTATIAGLVRTADKIADHAQTVAAMVIVGHAGHAGHAVHALKVLHPRHK